MDLTAFTFRCPESETEWQEYYELRWRVLRKPWNQPRESEKDQLEDQAFHVAAFDTKGHICAVGRLHLVNSTQAQLRYMAVEHELQRKGIGQQLLHSLEDIARNQGIQQITLNARDAYLKFYENNGYQEVMKAQTLFGCIPHTMVTKTI